jgi:hypothetical protein
LATIIMSKTKAELVDVARGLNVGVFELLSHPEQSAEALRALVDIIESARARQQIAAGIVALEYQGEGNDLRWARSRGSA